MNATKTSIQAQNHQKYFSGLSPDAKQLLNEIKEEENDIDSKKLVCTKSDGKVFNFNTEKTRLH